MSGSGLLRQVEHLRDVLWPGATVLVHRGVHPPGLPAGGRTWTFTVAPTAGRPRWLVGCGSSRAAADTLQPRDDATGLLRRLPLIAQQAGIRTGVDDALPRTRVSVVLEEEGLQTSVVPLLEALVDTPDVHLALPLMPARAHAKAVVRLADASGRRTWFAKIGSTPLSAELVRSEADTLRRLAEADLRTVHAPVVHHAGELQDLEVLLVRAERAEPGWRRRPTFPEAGHFRAVAEVFGRRATVLGETGLWHRLRRQHPTDSAFGDMYATALERAEALLDAAVDEGAWHGDWVAQNTQWHPGHLTLWDWEHFAADVPVGLDVLHRTFQPLLWGGPRAPVAALRRRTVELAAGPLLELGVPTAAHQPLMAVYTLAMADRLMDRAGALTDRNRVLAAALVRP